MAQKKVYDFDRPIRIRQVKSNGLDIIFYMLLLSALVAAILLILCMKDGKFGIYFELWRVLLSIPLIVLATFPAQLLKELRVYVPKLAKKATWTIEEMTAMTGKDRKLTERIMTRVLESAFIVDEACEKKQV
ncbi:MAG: hypothetical protein IJ240_08960 [Clostridia bacterium]|nr:hypothetical protein [Clostridia bacterium]